MLAGSSELLRVDVGEVSPEREHAAWEGEDHERVGDHLPRDAARLPLHARRHDAGEGRGRTSGGGRPPRHGREQRDERATPQVLGRAGGGIERGSDLGLEPGLLVEADLEIREDRELRPILRVGLEPALLVAGERLAQVALPVGRVAGPQPLDERLEPTRIGRLGGWALLEVARELEPDLLEHLEVPARDALAGAFERVERRVQLVSQAPDPRAGLEQATA